MAKTGPKPKYCYICQRAASQCTGISPCRTLKGEMRQKAYAAGYALKHAEEARVRAARWYESAKVRGGK